jgi:hypothetical protein
MTITTANTLNTFRGNGLTTVFPTNIYAQDETQIYVYSGTEFAQGDRLYSGLHYTLGNFSNVNGVVLTLSSAPSSTAYIRLYRVTTPRQTLDISNMRAFNPQVMENQLDHMTMGLQEVYQAYLYGLRAPTLQQTLIDVEGSALVWENHQIVPGPDIADLTYTGEDLNALIESMRGGWTVSSFTTPAVFFLFLETIGDYWPVGHTVQAGPRQYTKIALSGTSEAWIDTTPRIPVSTKLDAAEGAVEPRYLARMDGMTVIANTTDYPASADYVPIDEFMTAAGLFYERAGPDNVIILPADAGQNSGSVEITGAGTGHASGDTAVTFHREFANTPHWVSVRVIGDVPSNTTISYSIKLRSATGFTVQLKERVGTSAPVPCERNFIYKAEGF